MIPARRPFWLCQSETADSDNASIGWCARDMEKRVRQRGVRHGTPANASLMFPIHHTIGRWMSSFPPPRHPHIRSLCKQWLALSPPSFCPIVSSRVLIRSCCFFSKKKARNTYHDRKSAFTPPLLRGLGYLPPP